jgi:beta-lactam-binding protein with PASTA domain
MHNGCKYILLPARQESMRKTLFAGLIIAVLTTVGIAASSILPSMHADQGGDPNNKGPSQENAEERHEKKVFKFREHDADNNAHNDNGVVKSDESMHDGNGVDVQ